MIYICIRTIKFDIRPLKLLLAKRANLFLQVMSSYGVGLNNGQLVSQFPLSNDDRNLGLRTKQQFYYNPIILYSYNLIIL